MEPETKPLEVLTIGEMVGDFISAEKTDTLGNASTFRRYLRGSSTNIAVYVSRLGGESAVIARTGTSAKFHDLGAEIVSLTRSGVVTVSENGSMEHVGPLPEVQAENVTSALYRSLDSAGQWAT